MDIVESINRYVAGTDMHKGAKARMIKARDEIVRLREWIADEGTRSNVCTFYVLGKVCASCRCSRMSDKV